MTRWTEDQARAMGIPDGLKSGQCVTRAQRRIARGSPDLAETDVQGMLAKVPQDKRRKPRLPNKTETRFRDDFLSGLGRWSRKFIVKHEFAPIALNYGSEQDPAWYRADWVLWMQIAEDVSYGVPSAPLVYVEVKGGHVYPAARERFQAATGRYPELTFMMWQQKSKSSPWECLHASGPMVEVFV